MCLQAVLDLGKLYRDKPRKEYKELMQKFGTLSKDIKKDLEHVHTIPNAFSEVIGRLINDLRTEDDPYLQDVIKQQIDFVEGLAFGD